uniref:Uncharacterized protein n=1 Tax=Arundo donax TaxID=35708 RepID=A0A0A8ZRW1_ARUDO
MCACTGNLAVRSHGDHWPIITAVKALTENEHIDGVDSIW